MFQSEIRQYAPYFLHHNPTMPTIHINDQTNFTYNAYFLIGEENAYIKCANKVWYEVCPSKGSIKPINFQLISLKNIKIAAYAQTF